MQPLDAGRTVAGVGVQLPTCVASNFRYLVKTQSIIDHIKLNAFNGTTSFSNMIPLHNHETNTTLVLKNMFSWWRKGEKVL